LPDLPVQIVPLFSRVSALNAPGPGKINIYIVVHMALLYNLVGCILFPVVSGTTSA
jgi:hypothetical protein